jgi:dihydroxyacetone kinase-like protein
MSGSALKTVHRAVLRGADALESACDELCRLDSTAGDGDHGFAMAAAAKAIRADLTRQEPPSLAELTTVVAKQFSAVGGTMGALYSVLVEAVGGAASAEAVPFSAAQLEHLLAIAEAALADFGGAMRGDKTVIDAVAPAREAAEECARQELSPSCALAVAAAAAQEGALATEGMVAKVGRASRLGERSIGVVDPGAMSFAIALNALARSYAEDTEATLRDALPPNKSRAADGVNHEILS